MPIPDLTLDHGELLLETASQPAGVLEPLLVSDEVSEAEWDAFVDACPHSSGYHLWRWRRVFERTFGHRTLYLAARSSEGEVVGVLPAVIIRSWLFGRFMVSLPFVNYGGVLAASDAVARTPDAWLGLVPPGYVRAYSAS